MLATYSAWLAGQKHQPNHDLAVLDPWTGQAFAYAPLCTAEDVEHAIGAAKDAAVAMATLPAWQKAEVLHRLWTQWRHRQPQLTEICQQESGKPIKFAENEVARLSETFSFAADEARRLDQGTVLDFGASSLSAGVRGFTRRVPVGVCSFITPFNFPLNLVAHKIAPAIAAGCPFILKPADKTPLGALLLGKMLAEAGEGILPEGSWSILPAMPDEASALVDDNRLALLSFTGSDTVGWQLKAQAGRKRVLLELGGNATCIVDETHADDLADIAQQLVTGAYYQAGQSCISVQRVLAHRDIYDALKSTLIAAANATPTGDPADPETVNGPMIRPDAARKLRDRIDAAVSAGATLLCGGEIGGPWNNVMTPAVLENVPDDAELWSEEAFGPVMCLRPFDTFGDALTQANASRFGLQIGLFTRDRNRTMQAWDTLDAGAIIVGGPPNWRSDPMPYGGTKDSGLGREGPHAAIRDYTETRLLVMR